MFKFPQVPCVLIGLGLAASLFTGCADTVLQRGQAAEGVASLHFTKVMVIAITPDNFNRRMAEAADLNHLATASGAAARGLDIRI